MIEPKKTVRNTGASLWIVVAVVVVIAVAIVVVMNVISGPNTSRQLKDKLDEIRASGAPITHEELAASYYKDELGSRAGRELSAVFSRYTPPPSTDEPNVLQIGFFPEISDFRIFQKKSPKFQVDFSKI